MTEAEDLGRMLGGHAAASAAAGEEKDSLLRVLVVEDDENDYLLNLSVLKRAGYRLESLRVQDALALRDALEDRSWDLVLADFNMPQFDGPSALRIVKHYNPDIPFVLVSGSIGVDRAAATIAAGANDAVGKDQLSRLPAIVERELRLSRQRAEQHRASLLAKQTEVALKDSESRFLQFAENIPECFWLFDVAERRVVFANAAFERIWGEPLATLYRNPDAWLARTHADDRSRVLEAAERARFGGFDEEMRITRPDGETRWVHVRSFPIRDSGGVIRTVGGIASDITRNIEQQMQMQRLAHFDSLTALPNRFLFQERLGSALALSRRNGWRLAVFFVDLDRFKNVNDTLGHNVGDELLRLVAIRLKTCLRDSDTVGRLGGDEFALILPDLESTDMAALVAKKIVDVLEQPFHIRGHELFISASIGVTLFPEDAQDIETLVRNADTAMYRAKESGRNTYQFYTGEMNQRARERLAMENELRRALSRQQFELHYQPKLCCRTGAIVGVEALLRWRSPDRGLILPGEFVALLEETGLIIEIGAWVLREACRQTQAWHASGVAMPSVAVNVSGRQLEMAGFAETVREALESSGLIPAALEIELTESVLMRDAPAVVSILGTLKAMGVRLAVDDFGTGYSSLAYLKRFPIDCLKVDRSFVQDITADPDDASITRAIINMAHELALEVVAEGVETEGQLRLLVHGRCDQIQGYYFSRPLPAIDIEAMLRAGRHLDLHGLVDTTHLAQIDAELAGRRHLQADLMELDMRDELVRECEEWRQRNAATQALLHEMLDSVAPAMIGIAEDGLIAFANPAAERILAPYLPLIGMEAADALPPTIMALVTAEGPAEVTLVIGGQQVRTRAWSVGRCSTARGRVVVFEVVAAASQ